MVPFLKVAATVIVALSLHIKIPKDHLVYDDYGRIHHMDKFDIEIPPTAYDHKPTRPYLEFANDYKVTDAICSFPLFPQDTYLGCTKWNLEEVISLNKNKWLPDNERKVIIKEIQKHHDLCVIFISKQEWPEMMKELDRHEKAHCNGLLHFPDGSGLGWTTYDGKEVK